MAYATVNGIGAVEARLSLPRAGVWTAEALLNTQDVVVGPVTVRIGGLSFNGTVRRAGTFKGTSFVRIVGGAGGLSGLATPKSYRNAPISMPLGDIATGAGEALSSLVPASFSGYVLPHWMTAESSWGTALEALCEVVPGTVWRVLPDGALWAGTDTWETVNAKAEVISQDPLRRRVEVSILPQLLPGVTWYGGGVSYVEHRVSSEKLRTTVWFEEGA